MDADLSRVLDEFSVRVAARYCGEFGYDHSRQDLIRIIQDELERYPLLRDALRKEAGRDL